MLALCVSNTLLSVIVCVEVVGRKIKESVKRHLLNQIKSNHFYCHITTAQVPW